jgi:hypothetical protein
VTIDYVSKPGENPPPVPAGRKLCNADEMRILHNAFLWAYQEASGLVRSVTAAAPLRREWRATAGRSTGDKLAQASEAMLEVLKVHLRREVVEIVPVAEKVLTQKEWSAIAEHSIAAIPKSRLMPQLGLLLANSSPADRAEFFATLPGMVKVLYRVVGRRQYARPFRQFFPDRPVPATA